MPQYPGNLIGPISPTVASVAIELLDCKGGAFGKASGFVIMGNHGPGPTLVTNRHVLAGRHQETGAVLNSKGFLPDRIRICHRTRTGVEWREEAIFREDDTPRWVEHPDLGERIDVVLLALDNVTGVLIAPYDLGNLFPGQARDPRLELDIREGSDLVVVGYPLGLRAAPGKAVWIRAMAATCPKDSFDGLPRFLIDARTREGMSGSPVLVYSTGVWRNTSGELIQSDRPLEEFVGVYSGRINAESDLGFVWNPSVIRDIRDRGVRPQRDRHGGPL